MSAHHRHEKTDARATPLVLFGVGLAVFVVLSLAISVGMFRWMESAWDRKQKEAHPLAQTREVPDEPLLQVQARRDLDGYRQMQGDILNHYGWVSPQAGVVRIPIERAMDLIIEREELKSRQ